MKVRRKNPDSSSFRDPAGFVYFGERGVYRQINKVGAKNFERFLNSGLYDALVKKGIITPFEILKKNAFLTDEGYKAIKLQKIPYISYPYEWSFAQLKGIGQYLLTSYHLKSIGRVCPGSLIGSIVNIF
jgi:hypothetical protein